jgi:putative copper resistance protein D
VIGTACLEVVEASHMDMVSLVAQAGTNVGAVLFDAGLIAVAAIYLKAARQLRARGAAWSAQRTAAFLIGLFLLFVALGSGLATYDDTSFPAHVVQHVLLMMAAPPLLVLGRPVALAAQASSRLVQRRIVQMSQSQVVRGLGGWFGWSLYLVGMWVYFLTPVFTFSLHNQPFHAGVHVASVALGYFYWQSIIGLEGSTGPRFTTRIVGILAAMAAEAGLGFTLIAMTEPIANGFTLSATHLGGQLFLVGSMMASGCGLALVLYHWAEADQRRVLRLEAQDR